MKTKSLLLMITIMISLLLIAPYASAQHGAQPVEEPRDPELDLLETQMLDTIEEWISENENFKVVSQAIDVSINVNDNSYIVDSRLVIEIPAKATLLTMYIWEDADIETIKLLGTNQGSAGSSPYKEISESQGNLFFDKIVPDLNEKADEYREKKQKTYQQIHFESGEQLPRLPNLLEINISQHKSETPQTLYLQIKNAGSYENLDRHPFSNYQVFLSGGDYWFPGIIGSAPYTEFKIKINKPWHIYSQGKVLDEKISSDSAEYHFKSAIPQTQPVIIAGDFKVEKDTLDGIDIYGFYLTGGSGGKMVMDKSKEYLKYFSDLIGKYPYESFAIIESPMPVGYGYPSFTAIGTMVMTAHFTTPFALGHEILHNWFGSWIETPFRKGNWCEAMTTYFANYYYVEQTEGVAAGEAVRRTTLEDLSIGLDKAKDYPLKDFWYRKTDTDQAIGYHRGFYLVHAVRRMMGDDAFLKAIRTFYVDNGGKTASWDEVLSTFKTTSPDLTEKLTGTFDTFLNKTGIPEYTLLTVVLHKDESLKVPFSITGEIDRQGEAFNTFNFPYRITFSDGETTSAYMDAPGSTQSFEIGCAKQPVSIQFDPALDIYRFIPEMDRTLSLDRFFDDPSALVIIPDDSTDYTELSTGVQINGKSVESRTFGTFQSSDAQGKDIMILLSSEKLAEFEKFKSKLNITLPDGFQFTPGVIKAGGQNYDGTDYALLINIPNPSDEVKTLSILYATSLAELKQARSRIGFYKNDSWVVFQGTKRLDRGIFPCSNTQLTEIFRQMIVCDQGMCSTQEIN